MKRNATSIDAFPAQVRFPAGNFPANIKFVAEDRILVTVVTPERLPERIEEASFVSVDMCGLLFRLWQNGYSSLGGQNFGLTDYVCYFAITGKPFRIDALPRTVAAPQLQFAQLKEWNRSLFSFENAERRLISVEADFSERYLFGPNVIEFLGEAAVHSNPDRVDAVQVNSVRIEFAEPPSIVDLSVSLRSLQHFFDFVFGNPIHFEKIDAAAGRQPQTQGREPSEFGIFVPMRRRPGYSESVNLMNTSTIRHIKSNLQKYLDGWVRLWGLFADPIAVFYNSYYSDYVLDTQFMNVVAFLESYHKTFLGGSGTLEQRLLDLLQLHAAQVGFARTPPAQLARRMKETRNTLAHLDVRYSEYVDGSLHQLTYYSFILGECLLAESIGLEPEKMLDLVNARVQRFRLDI